MSDPIREEVLGEVDPEVTRLDELLREIPPADDATGLLREHLETARSNLLGSMPSEYAFNLTLAEELLPEIRNPEIHGHVRKFLRTSHRGKCPR